MQVPHGGHAQCLLQQDLAPRARQQVAATHHIGDTLLGVVDHDGELIGEEPITPAQHEVADGLRDVY